MLLLIISLGFAFAALDAFTEPWSSMDSAILAETIFGHLIALLLTILCFRAALYFGSRDPYVYGRHLRQRQL